MARKNNKHYKKKLDLILISCMSSSLLITSYALPISILASPLHSRHFIIAKTPDERQPEAVEKGIEQIPVAQPPVSQQRKEPIESPLPPVTTPTATGTTTPTPKPATTPSTSTATGTTTPTRKPATTPSTPTATGTTTPTRKPATTPSTPTATGTTPAPKPATTPSTSTATGTTTPTPKPATTPSTPTITRTTPAPTATRITPTPKSSDRLSTSGRQRTRQPVTGGSPISTSITPSFRKIDFVDIAFGVLAPSDYQSQGRSFHFYQFEGRENQLIQIRLTGSADQRRSNNLSLNPFLFLLDPNNQVLLKRGTGGAADSRGVKDAFIFVRLPAKGTYTIAVTSQNPREKGRYSLALRNDRASYSLDQSSELTLKNSTLRQNKSPYNVSKFQGKKDQLVSIRADSIFEEFSPYVVLLNSKGQIVASDSDKDGRYSALIDRAKLPADDTYYIVVISANAQERGTYRLTVF